MIQLIYRDEVVALTPLPEFEGDTFQIIGEDLLGDPPPPRLTTPQEAARQQNPNTILVCTLSKKWRGAEIVSGMTEELLAKLKTKAQERGSRQ